MLTQCIKKVFLFNLDNDLSVPFKPLSNILHTFYTRWFDSPDETSPPDS